MALQIKNSLFPFIWQCFFNKILRRNQKFGFDAFLFNAFNLKTFKMEKKEKQGEKRTKSRDKKGEYFLRANVIVLSKKREKCKTQFLTRRIKMNKKLSAKVVLEQLICILEMNLSELAAVKYKDDYTIGSWEACIECLEIIGCWTRAKDYGLTYNPELKFKLYNSEAARCFCPPTKTPRRPK